MKTTVVIKTQFTAVHRWSDCPIESVAFLRNPHRHVFYVTMKFDTMSDREIEFIDMKDKVNWHLRNNYDGRDLGTSSCETIASELLKTFDAEYVSVFEDNENGAEVTK